MADPVERLAIANREYGEYGGVNPSIEISTTFTGERGNSIPLVQHAGVLGFRRSCAVPATHRKTIEGGAVIFLHPSLHAAFRSMR
jgi:hypothetical protein